MNQLEATKMGLLKIIIISSNFSYKCYKRESKYCRAKTIKVINHILIILTMNNKRCFFRCKRSRVIIISKNHRVEDIEKLTARWCKIMLSTLITKKYNMWNKIARILDIWFTKSIIRIQMLVIKVRMVLWLTDNKIHLNLIKDLKSNLKVDNQQLLQCQMLQSQETF